MATATFDFAPGTAEEIELTTGDKVTVTQQDADGWWQGTNQRTGKSGLFPAAYVKLDE